MPWRLVNIERVYTNKFLSFINVDGELDEFVEKAARRYVGLVKIATNSIPDFRALFATDKDLKYDMTTKLWKYLHVHEDVGENALPNWLVVSLFWQHC